VLLVCSLEDLFREVIEISAYRDCERQGCFQSLVKLDGVALTADERELLLERYGGRLLSL
jgi:DNA polymerase III delta subunit